MGGLAGLIVCYGSFSVFRLALLLLFASQSLRIRGLGWSDLGRRLPVKVWRTVFHAILASFAILAAIRFAIVPFAVFVTGLVGDTRTGWLIAIVARSALFGLAHRYQGWAGVIAAGIIGSLLATLYLWNRKNLSIVIVCHGLVDTVALLFP